MLAAQQEASRAPAAPFHKDHSLFELMQLPMVPPKKKRGGCHCTGLRAYVTRFGGQWCTLEPHFQPLQPVCCVSKAAMLM